MDLSGNPEGCSARAPKVGDTRMGEARMGEGVRMGERDTPLRLSPFRMLRVLDSCRPPGNRIGESHRCHLRHQIPLHPDPQFSQIQVSLQKYTDQMTAAFNNLYEFNRFL